MKKLGIALLIIVLIGGAAIGIGAIVIKANPELYQDTYVEKSLTEEDVVTSLEINIASDDVQFLPSTDGKLSITYYEYSSDKYVYTFADGFARFTASTEFSFKKLFRFHIGKKPTMMVYLPNTINGELKLNLASGTLTAGDLNMTLKNLTVSLASGEINLAKATADAVKVAVTSGDLRLSDLTAKRAEVSMTSGDLTLNGCKFDETKLTLTSGKIDCGGSDIGDANASVVSGKLSGTQVTISKLSCNLSSGDITLSLTGSLDDYSFDGHASSGNMKILNGSNTTASGKDVRFGSGAKEVNASVTSGNIIISVG